MCPGTGRRGVSGQSMRDEDEVLMLIPARTLNTILFFSDRGKVYSEKAYQIPDANRTARGIPVVNILSLEANETITAAAAVPDFEAAEFCVMATRKGRIKRLVMSEFATVRPSGLIAITLDQGDELGWAHLTHGKDEVILVTEQGKALRFAESAVRPMGRAAAGVTAIDLAAGDLVASMEVTEPGGDLLVVTTGGYGKRSPLTEYPTKGRATSGVVTIDQKSLEKIGLVAAARVVQTADDLTIISTGGVILRTQVKAIKQAGRATRGVVLIALQAGDSVASIARIAAADLRQAGAAD